MRMSETRTLTITAMNPITSGVGNYGPWTLYDVTATDENGTPITNIPLKTFQELPVNTPIQVEVETQDRGHGTECILKKPKGARYALRQSPADQDYELLRQGQHDHEKRIAALEAKLGVVNTPTDVPAPPVQQPVTVPADDEIPF